MTGFTLDESKFVPAPKSFRYRNLVNNFSTKRGELYRFRSGSGWARYVDPEHVYSFEDGTARLMRHDRIPRARQ